jgi:hypothetical protein
VIMELPNALNELIDYRWPDSLWVAGEMHSEQAYTIWVLDIDYSYNEARACLSLDGRWTLSPVGGPWHTVESGQRSKESSWEADVAQPRLMCPSTTTQTDT